jgi:hypothetical protein
MNCGTTFSPVKTQFQSVSILMIVLHALALGTVVCLAAIAAQWLVYERIMAQPGVMRLVSPLIAGVSTGLFSLRLQVEQRNEWLAMQKRYRVIGEMNHHVRNALQVIAYSPYCQLEDNAAKIGQAVQRIEWVLREVLPEVNADENGRMILHKGAGE